MEGSKRGKSLDNLTNSSSGQGAAAAVATAASAAAVATVQQENDVLLARLAAVQQVQAPSTVYRTLNTIYFAIGLFFVFVLKL